MLTPTIRISTGLVLLTISIFMMADLFGIMPNQHTQALEARKKFIETLTVQLSIAAQRGDVSSINATIHAIVERNQDILSAAFRTTDNQIIIEAGGHDQFWKPLSDSKSTSTHAQVPIFKGSDQWAKVEVRFTPLVESGIVAFFKSPKVLLIAFITIAGFISYSFFLRRVLKQLDPSSVIPGRVKNTLDVMAEGVLVLDDKERIVLANSAFTDATGETTKTLLGRKASRLNWAHKENDRDSTEYPWTQTLQDGEGRLDVPMDFISKSGDRRSLVVNCSPILNADGKARGALVTLDDVTDLEEKNSELHEMLSKLESSRDEIRQKNKELEILATLDPLTNCLNRRSFFLSFNHDFTRAKKDSTELACIMCDIDYFKSVNDCYGHATGDNIIKRLAKTIKETISDDDVICRYGGEEFCVLLPDTSLEKATRIAELCREKIKKDNESDITITASFGVTSIRLGAESTEEIIDQADRALYFAKDSGRNCVIRWDNSSPKRHTPADEPDARSLLNDAREKQLSENNVTQLHPDQLHETDDADDSEINRLQQHNRWYSDTLDILSSMDNLHGDLLRKADPDKIFENTRQQLGRILNLETTAFITVDEASNTIELADWKPFERKATLEKQLAELISSGEFNWALGQNHVVEKTAPEGQTILLHAMTSGGKVQGMFMGSCAHCTQSISSDVSNIMSVIMNNAASALENTALYRIINDHNKNLEATINKRARELAHQQAHDIVTGLPNRTLFSDRITQSMARGRRNNNFATILLLDINNFKRINNSLGHDAGDDLLRMVGTRIAETLRATDSVSRMDKHIIAPTISRLEGDEFGILLTDIENTESIIVIVQRIISTLSRKFDVCGHEIFITTSIGISLHPSDGDCVDTLLKNANTAMTFASSKGQNTYQFYSDQLNTSAIQRLKLEGQLRHAIENKEFVVYYQPKVSLADGAVSCMEALIRWQHPEKGLVPPNDFISLAEDTGLIVPIGGWVLREACEQAMDWSRQGLGDINVAVNLSAVQFRQDNLLEEILSIIHETGIPPQRLELEITENIIMEDITAAIEVMNALNDLGVLISIDDFGIGYSSLNYLKQFPIDTLKIDRSFVLDFTTDKNDAAIVTSIIAMAHSMGLSVIAEGVERTEQMAALRALGCDEIQGYLFSPPVPGDSAGIMLQHRFAIDPTATTGKAQQPG